MSLQKKDFIFQDVNKLKGVGKQFTKYLKKKKIEKWGGERKYLYLEYNKISIK